MPVEFNCEHCDMLLSAEVEAGAEVTCPHCQEVTVVPEGLASLPRPRVPGQGGAEEVTQAPQRVAVDSDQDLEQEEPQAKTGKFIHVLALGMPWIVSLFFHIALLLILFTLVMYTILDKTDAPEKTEAIVPPERVDIYTDQPTDPSETKSLRPAENPEFAPSERPSPDKAEAGRISPIGIDAGSQGTGFAGMGTGSGGGGGGMWGSRAPGAGNVVYVIDRSGSMHKTFGLVRKEMLTSISGLSAEQDFHVILFAAGEPLEKKPDTLTPGEDQYKISAAKFLESVEPEGATDPIPALTKAFRVLARAQEDRPGKLIHLLTDGNFPDNQAALAAIRELNKKKDVHINTFLYGQRPKEAEQVLRRIADENSGTYKYVSPDEAY